MKKLLGSVLVVIGYIIAWGFGLLGGIVRLANPVPNRAPGVEYHWTALGVVMLVGVVAVFFAVGYALVALGKRLRDKDKPPRVVSSSGPIRQGPEARF
jgi:hypothetical protein